MVTITDNLARIMVPVINLMFALLNLLCLLYVAIQVPTYLVSCEVMNKKSNYEEEQHDRYEYQGD